MKTEALSLNRTSPGTLSTGILSAGKGTQKGWKKLEGNLTKGLPKSTASGYKFQITKKKKGSRIETLEVQK